MTFSSEKQIIFTRLTKLQAKVQNSENFYLFLDIVPTTGYYILFIFGYCTHYWILNFIYFWILYPLLSTTFFYQPEVILDTEVGIKYEPGRDTSTLYSDKEILTQDILNYTNLFRKEMQKKPCYPQFRLRNLIFQT